MDDWPRSISRASASQTPCRSGMIGFSSPQAPASRRSARTGGHAQLAKQHHLRRHDLDSRIRSGGQAAGECLALRQLYRRTSTRTDRRHHLQECRRGASAVRLSAERNRGQVRFRQANTTVAAFEINAPQYITLPDNSVSPNGEQVNRGIEINTFGELTPSLRVLGGVTFIDSTLTKTAGGLFDGQDRPGCGRHQFQHGRGMGCPVHEGTRH